MPTALELTRKDLAAYRQALRRKRKRSRPALWRTQRDALVQRVRAAADLLRSRFGAKRVVLFGSLAHEGWYDPASDVDLAVEGLSGADYWHAWREVEDVIGDRRVDLIDVESASESLRRAIERYGVEM
ncbi:MAG TPA: nucleotidyltransferase domain-containing protein [Syntrophobacteria bacterium]|nr:nucleotidyltransferase domain-containing protein [Syntrophobacteria bacterium]